MKIDLSRKQWLDIQMALLGTMSMIEKHSNIEFKKNPLIQKNLRLHTIIANAMKEEEYSNYISNNFKVPLEEK
tara:strand:+ start:274 stop:492 length:219 start_codon:yes stop_codon:yes gene_type:complete